jgi:hypothetical protein
MRKTKPQRGDGEAEVGSGKKKRETKKSEIKLKTVEINKTVEMKAAKSSTKDGKTTKQKGNTSTSSNVTFEKTERNQSSPRRKISPQKDEIRERSQKSTRFSKVNRRSISPQIYRPEQSKVSAKTEKARKSMPFFVHKEAIVQKEAATTTAPSNQSKFSDSLSDEKAGEPESGKGTGKGKVIADPVVMSDTCIDYEIDFCLLPYLTLLDEFCYHGNEMREYLGGSRERGNIQPVYSMDYSFLSSADFSNEDQSKLSTVDQSTRNVTFAC